MNCLENKLSNPPYPPLDKGGKRGSREIFPVTVGFPPKPT
jgi:hypothetical protein